MLGLSTMLLTTIAFGVVGLAGLVVGGVYYYRFQSGLDEQLDAMFEESDEVEFEPPKMRLTPMDYWRAMRHLQFQKKAAEKGYVKWFRIGSNMKRAKWVKPKQDGKGAPKYTVDGQPYYFNKDAMTTDAETGAWVAVHLDGECDPVNLPDPAYPGIEVDLMERVINLEAESKPPGFLDSLSMDTKTLMWVGIGGLFLLFAAYRYSTGAM